MTETTTSKRTEAARTRPRAVTVIATLLLAAGVLNMLLVGFGVTDFYSVGDVGDPIAIGLLSATGLVLLYMGFGLLHLAPWARVGTMVTLGVLFVADASLALLLCHALATAYYGSVGPLDAVVTANAAAARQGIWQVGLVLVLLDGLIKAALAFPLTRPAIAQAFVRDAV